MPDVNSHISTARQSRLASRDLGSLHYLGSELFFFFFTKLAALYWQITFMKHHFDEVTFYSGNFSISSLSIML